MHGFLNIQIFFCLLLDVNERLVLWEFFRRWPTVELAIAVTWQQVHERLKSFDVDEEKARTLVKFSGRFKWCGAIRIFCAENSFVINNTSDVIVRLSYWSALHSMQLVGGGVNILKYQIAVDVRVAGRLDEVMAKGY